MDESSLQPPEPKGMSVNRSARAKVHAVCDTTKSGAGPRRSCPPPHCWTSSFEIAGDCEHDGNSLSLSKYQFKSG